MIRRFAILSVAGALALAGCTSSGGGAARTDSPAPTTGTPSSSAKTTPITQPKSVPASVPNSAGVIKDKLVSITSCKATSGGWQASGTAKGKSGKKATYTVTVFFTTNRATVQAFGQTKVTVAKGKSATWTVAKKFTATPSTLCVLRGAG